MTEKDDIVLFEMREDLDREAAVWVARQDARDMTPDEQAELEAWLAANPIRRASYERAQHLWSDFDALHSLRPDTPLPAAPRPVMKAAALAACLLVMVGTLAIWLLHGGSDTMPGRYVTAVGEQKTVALEDGSSIILNTNTDLEVLYGADLRLIRLNRGEAYFEVAKDKRRRFRVEAGENAVVAVGTAFAVHRKIGEVDISVSHGIVEVQQSRSAPEVIAMDEAPDNKSVMNKTDERIWTPVAAMVVGQRVRIPKETGEIIREDHDDVARLLDWTDGKLVFEGEPLADVAKAIGRYSGYRFDIADTALNDLRIGGVFKVGDVNGLVEALEVGFGVKAEFVGETEIKLSR